MFCPLVPVRFSAPQLEPEPGSPAPFVPYVSVICSLAGVVPSRSQTSNECVVGFEKFRTPAQSTTSQVSVPSVSVAIRIAPAVLGSRSVHQGAITLFGRAEFGNVCGT